MRRSPNPVAKGAFRTLSPDDLQMVTGGSFPVKVAWQIMKHPVRAGDSSLNTVHDQIAARDAREARERRQAGAQAWAKANPDFFKPQTIQQIIQATQERTQQSLAAAAKPASHPQMRSGR